MRKQFEAAFKYGSEAVVRGNFGQSQGLRILLVLFLNEGQAFEESLDFSRIIPADFELWRAMTFSDGFPHWTVWRSRRWSMNCCCAAPATKPEENSDRAL